MNCLRDLRINTLRKRKNNDRTEYACPRCGYWTWKPKDEPQAPAPERPAAQAPAVPQQRFRLPPLPTRRADMGNKVSTGNPRLNDLLYGGLDPRGQVMIAGPAFIGKETLANQFVIDGLEKGEACIILTTDMTPEECVEELKAMKPEVLAAKRENLHFIDCYSPSMGLTTDERNVVQIDHPTELNKVLEKLSTIAPDKERRILVRSISTFLSYTQPIETYRFLQMLTGRNKNIGAVAMYLIDRGMHSETDIQTLSHLMDGSIEFKTDGVKTYLRIDALGDVQSRAWIQYQYSKKGIIIGSFSLDHLR